MAYYPINFIPFQFENSSGLPASGYVLKAYDAAFPSSPIPMAIDSDGLTTVASITLNSNGYPSVSSNVVIPYVDRNYNLSLYPSQDAADSNTGAIWTVIDKAPITLSSLDDAMITGDATAENITVSGTARFNADVIIVDSINDVNSNELIKFGTTAAAVNEITVTNAATGNAPLISATGNDTNVDLNLQAKGSGVFNLKGTSTAPAKLRLFENTTNGSNYISVNAPASLTANYDVNLPAALPVSKKSVQIDAAGNMTFDGPTNVTNYVSTGQTFTNGSTVTVAHGLGAAPSEIVINAVCTTTSDSYTAGDKIYNLPGQVVFNSGGSSFGLSTYADATNVNLGVCSNGILYRSKTNASGNVTLTAANWQLYIIAKP